MKRYYNTCNNAVSFSIVRCGFFSQRELNGLHLIYHVVRKGIKGNDILD